MLFIVVKVYLFCNKEEVLLLEVKFFVFVMYDSIDFWDIFLKLDIVGIGRKGKGVVKISFIYLLIFFIIDLFFGEECEFLMFLIG